MVETVRLYLPVSPVRLRADEGIGPYAGGEVFATQPGPAYAFRGPLHTRQGFALPPSPSRRGLFSLYFSASSSLASKPL